MSIKTDLQAAIQALADAGTSVRTRIAIGTPGSRVLDVPRARYLPTGSAWAAGGFLDVLTAGVAAELGTLTGSGLGFGVISTNASGIAPSLQAGAQRITSAVKDGTATQLTVNYAAYTNAPVVLFSLDAQATLWFPHVVSRSTTSVVLSIRDGLSTAMIWDNRTVTVTLLGI